MGTNDYSSFSKNKKDDVEKKKLEKPKQEESEEKEDFRDWIKDIVNTLRKIN